MSAGPRLDMRHGFMRHIIRNQVDRDNYDKEVKAQKANHKEQKNKDKNKKPAIQTYTPPKRQQPDNMDNDQRQMYVRKPLFKLEYEDQDENVHYVPVYKNDDPAIIAEKFGCQQGLTEHMIQALTNILSIEMEKASGES